MNRLKIHLIDDHPIIANSIKREIDSKIFNTCISNNLADALKQNKLIDFDLSISDIRLKNGENSIPFLKEVGKKAENRLIIYSSYTNPWLLLKLKRLDICPLCIINKTDNIQWGSLLQDAISGKSFYSEEAASSQKMVFNEPIFFELSKLTIHKWEILKLFVSGHSDKSISETYSISRHTVNGYRKEIYKILGVKDAPSMILWFSNIGFFDIEN